MNSIILNPFDVVPWINNTMICYELYGLNVAINYNMIGFYVDPTNKMVFRLDYLLTREKNLHMSNLIKLEIITE